MKLASIQTITNIREIPGADRIEAATVLGHQTVIKKSEFRFTLAELVDLASAQDYAPGRAAEGIVIRPVEEARSLILESGRLSANAISESYALKHGE